MPLAALPTELDISIFEHVTDEECQHALYAMSCTSKSYRKVAEPIIYRHIVICNHVEFRVKRLLMTLLDRKDLALHIKSFALLEYETSATGFGYRVRIDLDEDADALKNALNSIQLLTSGLPLFAGLFWDILMKHRDSFNPQVDAALALILVMATNIESIQLPFSWTQKLGITGEVLALPWQLNHYKASSGPFSKLSVLRVEGSRTDDVLSALFMKTSAKSLVVRNCRIISIPYPRFHTLQQLELRGVKISPSLLEALIISPAFRNLRQLSLRSLTDASHGWYAYRYSALTEALVRNVPNLEVFECISMETMASSLLPLTFGSFTQLVKLNTLRIDLSLLIHIDLAGHVETIWDYTSALPKNIKHLELAQFSFSVLEYVLASHIIDDAGLEGFGNSALFWQFVANPAPMLALESFTLNLVRDYPISFLNQNTIDLEEAALAELKHMADKAMDRGLVYRVYEPSKS